jgi:hypothetical protein
MELQRTVAVHACSEVSAPPVTYEAIFLVAASNARLLGRNGLGLHVHVNGEDHCQRIRIGRRSKHKKIQHWSSHKRVLKGLQLKGNVQEQVPIN